MISKEKIISIIRDNLPYLVKEYKISTIGVFGSYSKENFSEDSDVDIIIEFSKTPGIVQFVKLKDFLSSILGKQVDLVTKQALKPELKSKILSETIYA